MKNNTKKVVDVLLYLGYEAYIVGGCVRDRLMNREPHDIDICTNATVEEMKKAFKDNDIVTIPSGEKFGTITALVGSEAFEVTTYRKDIGIVDCRHPKEIVKVNSIKEDLSRRDFTMNAIAMDVNTNELVDPFNGKQDIENRIIRCVGDPDQRFKEDALRILRAMRFAIVLEFNIDKDTLDAMNRNAELLNSISNERVTQEFMKMLGSGKSIEKVFKQCPEIIKNILPELKACDGFELHSKYHTHDVYTHILKVTDLCKTKSYAVKMAALLHDIGKIEAYTEKINNGVIEGHTYKHPEISHEKAKEILKRRFKFSSNEEKLILDLILYHDYNIQHTNKSIKKTLKKIGIDTFNNLLIIKEADQADHIRLDELDEFKNGNNVDIIRNMEQQILDKNDCFNMRDLAISGYDIMSEFNLKQGKQIGYILSTLLNQVINEEIDNSRQTLIKRAYELLK